jgi:hypothetical protein
MVVLDVVAGKLQIVASAIKAFERDRVHVVSDKRLLAVAKGRTYLYSADLKDRTELPIRFAVAPSPGAYLVGEQKPSGWNVYSLTRGLTLATEGAGMLAALSNKFIVFRNNGILYVQSPDGKPAGRFSFGSQGDVVELAGTGAMFLNIRGDEKIVDFGGRVLARIAPPAGWDFTIAGVPTGLGCFLTILPEPFRCRKELQNSSELYLVSEVVRPTKGQMEKW